MLIRRKKFNLDVHFIADRTSFGRTKLFTSYQNKLQTVITVTKF